MFNTDLNNKMIDSKLKRSTIGRKLRTGTLRGCERNATAYNKTLMSREAACSSRRLKNELMTNKWSTWRSETKPRPRIAPMQRWSELTEQRLSSRYSVIGY